MAQMVDRTGTGRAVYQLEGTLLGLSLVAELTGRGATLHHDQLIEGDLSPWLALGLFLAAWQVMIAAMMLPSSLPMLDLFDRVSAAQPGHRRARWAFLAGYAVVWTGFGALAFQLDGLVHRTVDATPWLAQRPWLVAGATLLLAGGFQFSDGGRRAVRPVGLALLALGLLALAHPSWSPAVLTLR